MSLSGLGTCSYGHRAPDETLTGFTFSEKADTRISGKPNLDQAKRTVVSVTYTILVRDYVLPGFGDGFSTENEMLSVRRILTKPGGELTYLGKGFGQLVVNAPGQAVLDAQWGPIPEILEWNPVGSATTAKIVWRCTTTIPECSSAVYAFEPMEFNFRVSYSTDFCGLTTRTYSGFIRIPQTRPPQTFGTVQNRLLQDNADAYRANIMPAIPVGFRRRTADFTLDESKCRMDFNIVDEQLPTVNAPPPGVIEVDDTHEVETNDLLAGVQWSGRISATYTLAPDQSRVNCWPYFFNLVAARRAFTVQYGSFGQSAGFWLATSLRFGERMHDTKSAWFSLGYMMTTSLQTVLAASGMWTPIPDSNWNAWATSLASNALDPQGRGTAKLRFTNAEDMIVDLCIGGERVLNAQTTALVAQPGANASLLNAYPDPGNSFIWYEMHARIDQKDQIAEMKALPASVVSLSSGPGIGLAPNRSQVQLPVAQGIGGTLLVEGLGPVGSQVFGGPGPQGNQITSNTDGFDPIYLPNQPSTVPQVRAQPSQYVILEGFALRAGYLITAPWLTNVQGIPVVPKNREDVEYFKAGVVANFFGVPIVRAKWRLRYLVTQTLPNNVGVPPNPLLTGL